MQPAVQWRHLKRSSNTENRKKPLKAKRKPDRRKPVIDKDELPDKNASIDELNDFLKKHMQQADKLPHSKRGNN